MSNVLLAHVVPDQQINTVLFTVDNSNLYYMCNLIITNLNNTGIAFNCAISKESTPNPQDYVYFSPDIITNENGQVLNHYILEDLLVAQGESVIVYTTLPNLSFRLTGYPYPYVDQASVNVN